MDPKPVFRCAGGRMVRATRCPAYRRVVDALEVDALEVDALKGGVRGYANGGVLITSQGTVSASGERVKKTAICDLRPVVLVETGGLLEPPFLHVKQHAAVLHVDDQHGPG